MPKKTAKSDPQVKQECTKDRDVADLLHRDATQAGPPPLWTLVCPITNAIFEEPVVASDGRTYSKKALLSLMATCKDRGLPVTSPFGISLSECEKLEPHVKMEEAICQYREERARMLARDTAPGPPPAMQLDTASSQPVKSIAELGRMFALLDNGLRELLDATIDGWQPPQIVVVGEESSGKSSVLERLMMMPLLPRAETTCTRIPIHVRLRYKAQAEPPTLEVFNVRTKTTERGPYVIAAQSGAADVSEEMGRIIMEEQGALRGVSAARIIILHVSSPDVPFLDLIDMPGLVTAPSGTEPSDMANQTKTLVKDHIKSDFGSNSLYLAIVKGTSAPNTSIAMEILHEAGLYNKTFGVFTFCDLLNRKSAPLLMQWVRNEQNAVVLDPYGWVATTNTVPQDEHDKDKTYENNLERLHAQADGEVAVLKEVGLGDLIKEERASHGVLVSRLNEMFIKNLATTWVPKTLQKLDMERKKLRCGYVMLGMPPAHKKDELPRVRDAIVKAVEETLDRNVSSLLKDYCASTLSPLKQEIQKVVRKAVTDAFCFPALEEEQRNEEKDDEDQDKDKDEDEDEGEDEDLIIDVQLENFDQVCERVPDVLTPLMKLMSRPKFFFDTNAVRDLFSEDKCDVFEIQTLIKYHHQLQKMRSANPDQVQVFLKRPSYSDFTY